MAVLFNKTSSGWRSQSKGTFLKSSEGDIIIKFQQAQWISRCPTSPRFWEKWALPTFYRMGFYCV